MGKGFPDSGNVKSGARAIKFHLDYMAWMLDRRIWLAGDAMTLADFAAAAHLRRWTIFLMWTGTGRMWSSSGMPRSNHARRFGVSWSIRCRDFHHLRIMPIWISEKGTLPPTLKPSGVSASPPGYLGQKESTILLRLNWPEFLSRDQFVILERDNAEVVCDGVPEPGPFCR